MVRLALSVAFVVGLVAAASASPVAAPSKTITVPLSKRAHTQRHLGTLKKEVHRVRGKYAQSLTNYERNTGRTHPIARAPAAELRKRAVGSEALTDEGGEEFWQGAFSVGTPAQKFNVDFDTGSSDTFFNPGSYKPGSSSTAVNTGASFTVAYGDGSSAKGTVYQDSFSVAGISGTSQSIGLAKTSSLNLSPSSGLSGLAFPNIAQFRADPYYVTLIKQGKLTSSVFSIGLYTSGAELTLGGIDSSKFTGSITYTSVDSSEGFWATKGTLTGGISVNPAIIDTGTTLFIGPVSSVKKFWSALGVSTVTDSDGSVYGEYTTAPKVTFTVGGAAYTISADALSYTTDGSKTVGGIIGADIGIDGWIVGDTFLQNVYAVFDFGNTRVGFAPKA